MGLKNYFPNRPTDQLCNLQSENKTSFESSFASKFLLKKAAKHLSIFNLIKHLEYAVNTHDPEVWCSGSCFKTVPKLLYNLYLIMNQKYEDWLPLHMALIFTNRVVRFTLRFDAELLEFLITK